MDQFMVDVTDIPQAKELDEVILVGRQGDEEITVDELGDLCVAFLMNLSVISANVYRVSTPEITKSIWYVTVPVPTDPALRRTAYTRKMWKY